MFTISQEVEIFIWSALSGVIIMMIYDVFSLTRSTHCFSVLVCNICDGVFVVTAATVMTFVIFSVSNGYVRSYEFIGAALGGVLYKITVSRYISFIIRKSARITYTVFTKIFKILLTPLRFMYKIICSIIGVLYRVAGRLLSPVRARVGSSFHTIRKTFRKT